MTVQNMALQEMQTVTVTGHGSASAAPDTLAVNIGVEVNRPSLAEAYRDASQSMRSVQQALQDSNTGASSSTSGLSLRSETAWQEGQGSRVTGYSCSSTLTVRMPFQDDAQQSGAQQAMTAIVTAGGDDVRINGLAPEVSDRGDVSEQARTLAWADALRQATHFAELAGVGLGTVVQISQGQESFPPVPALRQVAYSPEAMPLEAGEHEVSASVTVTWKLETRN